MFSTRTTVVAAAMSVVVTHEMAFARAAADRIVFMSDGKIVEDAAPDQFFDNPRNPRTRAFLGQIL